MYRTPRVAGKLNFLRSEKVVEWHTQKEIANIGVIPRRGGTIPR